MVRSFFGFDMVNSVHDGIVVYDLLDSINPTTIYGADDGTWQRLAN
jgi:ABC-type Fe2+-enterobactin transport system substrate-binding protein